MRLPSLILGRDRARDRLGLEIALMLALKVALIYALWHAFFSQPVLKKMTVGLDPARVAAVLVSPSANAVPTGLTFVVTIPISEDQP